MSRDRQGSTTGLSGASARRRRYDSEDADGGDVAASPAASRRDKLDKAERIQAEREQQEAAEAEAKAARKAARAAAKRAAAAAEEDDGGAEEDEEAARRARKAKRLAAKEAERAAAAAADDAPVAATPKKAAAADKMDLLRDMERDREEVTAPRFKKALQSKARQEEEEAAAAAAAAAAASAAKPKRRPRRDEDDENPVASPRTTATPARPRGASITKDSAATPLKARERVDSGADSHSSSSGVSARKNSASAASPSAATSAAAAASSVPASAAKSRSQPIVEAAEDSEGEAEAGDQVDNLPNAGAPAGIAPLRTGSFSGGSLPGSGANSPGSNDWDSIATRARVSSIVSSQKSLDVIGLNRILDRIPKVFFQKENFNPFNHWNDAKEELETWQALVEQGIAKIVEAYHKGFNTATSSFSHVLRNFNDSQKIVRKLQEHLSESKRLLQSRNQNLKDYHFQNRMVAHMKEILEMIEYVTEVPRWIEHYFARKQYVHVVVLLQHTLRLLVSEELVAVEGLSELREEILVRKHFVQMVLQEELARIIYGKDKESNSHLLFVNPNGNAAQRNGSAASSSTESILMFNADGTRVKSTLAADAGSIPTSNAASGRSPNTGATAARPTPADSKYSPFYEPTSAFDAFALASDSASAAAADPKSKHRSTGSVSSSPDPALRALLHEETSESYLKNPEANPHKFLALLVEALDHMNHLPSVKTQINKRVRTELLAIVQRETALAKEKSKFSLPRRVLARATESGYLTQGSDLLVDLIERIFHVLAHVLKNHLDVIQMISLRLRAKGMMGNESSSAGSGASSGAQAGQDSKFSIEGVWQVIQIVLQTTLSEYLHSEDDGSRSGPRRAVSESSQSTLAAAAAALKRRVAKEKAFDLLNDLTFTFEDSAAPSVAKMSRGEKPKVADHRARAEPTGADESSLNREAEEALLAAQAAARWIDSTPYNITAIYRSVVKFTEHANALIRSNTPPKSQSDSNAAAGALSPSSSPAMEDDLHSEGSQLRNFLKIFIEISFLPRVEADVNIRLDEILSDPSAFDARELTRDTRYAFQPASSRNAAAAAGSHHSGSSSASSSSLILRSFPASDVEHNLLLKCVLDLSDVLKKNFTDMYMLPHSVPEFLRIIEASCGRLLEKCSAHFLNELVRQTSNPRAAGTVPSPQSLFGQADDKVLSMLEADPLLHILRVGDREAMASIADLEDEMSQYFSPINPIYAPLFARGARLDKSTLNFDTRIWSAMSLMAESMEWIADRVFHLNVFSPENARMFLEAGGEPMRGGIRGLRARGRLGHAHGRHHHGPTLDSFRKVQALERKRHGNAFPAVLARRSLVDQKRWMLAEAFLQQSDRCLFTLRLELHSHLFFYLSEMQSGAYWCATDSLEPESFVTDCNRDLVLIDEAIGRYLSTARRRYVMGGLAELITSILVRNMAHLQDKRINSKGVAKICRNCFALQQNLTNIEGASSSNAAASASAHVHAAANAAMAHIHGAALHHAAASSLQEGHFDRARQYYELLNYSQEDLLLFQLENPDMFSADEYAALAAIQTQGRAPEGRTFA